MNTPMKTNGCNIRIIAALFMVTVVLVPGQNTAGQGNSAKPPFKIVIAVESATIKAGSGVSINARLANTSNQPLDASGCYCGPSGLDSLFTWVVRDKGHLTAKKVYPHPELATGEVILDRVVQPGSELSGDQDISRLYDMTKPGKYVIQASRAIPKEMGGGVVKSNAVTVTVTP
ncbi:MAG: hypothetical protein WBF09_20615 [Candidatus Acidiferrum sp.]